jgi:hypothetical protein
LLRQAFAPKQVPNRDVADVSTAPGEGGSKSTLGHLWFRATSSASPVLSPIWRRSLRCMASTALSASPQVTMTSIFTFGTKDAVLGDLIAEGGDFDGFSTPVTSRTGEWSSRCRSNLR